MLNEKNKTEIESYTEKQGMFQMLHTKQHDKKRYT